MNTIILAKAEANLTKREYQEYTFGSLLIDGDWIEEITRWKTKDERKAIEALKETQCIIWKHIEHYEIVEYALIYCTCDEDGNFIEGSDYTFAELNEHVW